MTKEYEWNYWRLRRKIGWRIKNINFLILVKLFHVRNLGIYFDKKKNSVIYDFYLLVWHIGIKYFIMKQKECIYLHFCFSYQE